MWVKNQGMYMGQWADNKMHGYGMIRSIFGKTIGCQFIQGEIVRSELRCYCEEDIDN